MNNIQIPMDLLTVKEDAKPVWFHVTSEYISELPHVNLSAVTLIDATLRDDKLELQHSNDDISWHSIIGIAFLNDTNNPTVQEALNVRYFQYNYDAHRCIDVKDLIKNDTTRSAHNCEITSGQFNQSPLVQTLKEQSIHLANIASHLDDIGYALKDCFPYNLYVKIIGNTDNYSYLLDLVPGNLIQLLYKLTSHELIVIYYRYGRKCTLAEIGTLWECTGERVRQIENKALRKLRQWVHYHPRVTLYTAAEYEYAVENMYDIATDVLKLSALKSESSNKEKEQKLIEASTPLFYELDNLDLTVRCYNCLKRAGIHNLLQLTTKNFEYLRKIRNIGDKNIIEIMNLLDSYGLSLLPSQGLVDYRANQQIKNNQPAYTQEQLEATELVALWHSGQMDTRLYNILVFNVGISKLSELSEYTSKEIANIEGLGPSTLTKIIQLMGTYGITFRKEA